LLYGQINSNDFSVPIYIAARIQNGHAIHGMVSSIKYITRSSCIQTLYPPFPTIFLPCLPALNHFSNKN